MNQQIPNCDKCMFQAFSVFQNLTKEELISLSFEKNCQYHQRGNIVYQEGFTINGIYCINKGVVKLYKTGDEGKEQIIRFAIKGDIFGYRSSMSDKITKTSAKVIDDAVICHIPLSKIFNLVKSNPSFSIDLMQHICKDLNEVDKLLLDISQKTVRERLAEVLFFLQSKFGLDKNNFLKITLTREEIANLVGTATESVIRLLSEFKQDKFIEISGRKIKFLNINGIKKVANIYSY